MARGVITPIANSRDGLDLSTVNATVGDPANGHTIANSGRMWIEAKNTNAGATVRHVTFRVRGAVDGQSIVPREEPIPAGKTLSFGPFPTSSYGGQLLVDVDHAEVTIKALMLGD